MKTAISVPDDTFQRVELAAKRLGLSRSEFYARAAQSWLDALDDEDTATRGRGFVWHPVEMRTSEQGSSLL
jgi:hypothetical protein